MESDSFTALWSTMKLADFAAPKDLANSLIFPTDPIILNILVYTDDCGVTDAVPDNPKLEDKLGIWRMKKLMKQHESATLKFNVEVVNRNERGHHASNRLTPKLLARFDEVWFFGVKQLNVPNPIYNEATGGMANELEDSEVEALEKWMANRAGEGGGGILLLGDHSESDPRRSNYDPDVLCPSNLDTEAFLGLGRALGHRIPRAGQLRKWYGPPTACMDSNYNTQVRVGTKFISEITLQKDAVPQQLLLLSINQDSDGGPDSIPHDLFKRCGTDNKLEWIQVFPDHLHEGEVVLPDGLDDEWPTGKNGKKIKPIIVAYGLDKRFANPPRAYPMVAVYDGDNAGVGRIVADSTWHHYVNINLAGFFGRSGKEWILEQIGQYYANLAYWLAPRHVRERGLCRSLLSMVQDPLIMEELNTGCHNLGIAAESVLFGGSPAYEINEMLRSLVPDKCPSTLTTNCDCEVCSVTSAAQREITLGAIVFYFHKALVEMANPETREDTLQRTFGEIHADAVNRALQLLLTVFESAVEQIRGKLAVPAGAV